MIDHEPDPRGKLEVWDSWVSRQESLLEEVVGRTLQGFSPGEIALEMGLPKSKLARWIEEDDVRREAVLGARRAHATELMYEGLRDVEGALADTVGLAKLRADHKTRVAGKFDRASYGDAQVAGVSISFSAMPSESEIVGRLIEMSRDEGFVGSLPAELRSALGAVALGGEQTGGSDAKQIEGAGEADAGGGARVGTEGQDKAGGAGGDGA